MWGNKPPGHCFLVKYESNQVIFVDANFGSFSFADWDSFGSWFAEKFWSTSKYGYSYHSFSIMTYEKVNI